MASRARGGQRSAAGAQSAGGGNRKAQPAKPDPSEIVASLIPVLEAYGYHEAEIHALVKRCNYDATLIDEAVSHIFEQREGHEHGEWSTTATATEKKQMVATAKERKAQKEKDREEEIEREKQRRQKVQEDEKKRHLEMAARRAEVEANKKNKPGSALVQRAAPWNPSANKDGDDQDQEGQGTPQEEDYAEPEETAENSVQAPPSESWTEPVYDAPEAPANVSSPVSEPVQPAVHVPAPVYAQPANGYLAAPPGVPVPEHAAAEWSAQSAGEWESSSPVQAQAQAQARWSSPWPAEPPAEPTNGKAQWNSLPPASSPAVPSVVPIANDTVTMPPSFWDLIGNGPIPQVMFGSLHVQSSAGEAAAAEAQQGEASASHEDEGRSARREPRGQYGDRRGGGKDGGGKEASSKEGGGKKGGRREKGGSGSGKEAAAEGAADDGKGKSKKGSGRGGGSGGGGGDRSGPSSGGKGGKNWRAEKGGQKGSGGKASSQ